MALPRLIDRIGETPVVRFWVRFSAAGPAVLAGAIAYNIIFALVPGGIVLVTAASFFGKTKEALEETVRVISLIAPVEVAEEIGRVLESTSGIVAGREGVIIALGALLALWFGTRAILTIMRVLTRVEDIDEDRPWWETRLIATGLTMAVGLALVLSSVLVIAGGAIEDWLNDLTELAWPVDLWSALRLPLATGGVLAFFWLLYRFAPPRRLPGTWLAAFMATGGMVGLSLGLQYYLDKAGGLGPTYATFGAVGLLLLWLFVVSYLIIVSGSVAAAAARRRLRRQSGQAASSPEETKLGLETLEQEAVGRHHREEA
jgi:membrane protein